MTRVVYLSGIIVSLAYLLYYYRNVGLHDGYVYIKAGQDIINGNNPYTTGDTRSGTASAVLIFFINSLVPGFAQASVFQSLNLLGVAWFGWVVGGKIASENGYLLLILATIWISPVREMLAINQVNGLVLGLLGTALHLETKRKNTNYQLSVLMTGFCLAMAVDIKPHLLLVFVIAWSVLLRRISLIFLTFGQLALAHLLVDLYVGEITEITWFSRLRDIEDSAGTSKLGDSVTIWPILEKSFPTLASWVPTVSLSLFLVMSGISIYFALRKKYLLTLLTGFSAPAFYIYFHFYDLIPVAVLFLVLIINAENKWFDLSIFGLLVIPKEFTSIRNLTLVLVLTTLVHVNNGRIAKNKLISYIPIKSFLLYGGVCLLNTQLFLTERLTQSIFVTEILFLLIWRIFTGAAKINVYSWPVSKTRWQTLDSQ